jgi:hypothetical protein
MNLLIKKKELVESKMAIKIDLLLYISISGFTEDALKDERVWCIGSKELNAILDRFNLRKIDELDEIEE